MVASRPDSVATALLMHKSGSDDCFDFDFCGNRIKLATHLSGVVCRESGLASFDDAGGGGNGNDPSLCLFNWQSACVHSDAPKNNE